MNSFGLNSAAINASSRRVRGTQLSSALLSALAFCVARAGRVRHATSGHVIGVTGQASSEMTRNATAQIHCQSDGDAVGTAHVAGMGMSSTACLSRQGPGVLHGAWAWIRGQGQSHSSSGAVRGSGSQATANVVLKSFSGSLRGGTVIWTCLNAMSVVPSAVRRARATWRGISAISVLPGAVRGAAAQWLGINSLSVVPIAVRNTSAEWLAIIRMYVVPLAVRSAAAKWHSISTLSVVPGVVRGGAAIAWFAVKTVSIPLRFVATRAGMLAQALLRSSLSANYIGRTTMRVLARCTSIPIAIRPGHATQASLSRLRSVALRYRFVSALMTGQARLSADAVANADVPAQADRNMIVTNDFRVFFISPEPRTMRIT